MASHVEPQMRVAVANSAVGLMAKTAIRHERDVDEPIPLGAREDYRGSAVRPERKLNAGHPPARHETRHGSCFCSSDTGPGGRIQGDVDTCTHPSTGPDREPPNPRM